MQELLANPLNLSSRIMVFLAALCLIPTLFLPLWSMNFWAQQYPEGLVMHIYSDKLVGGDDGNDLTEINVLNHYIGMAELKEEDFTEFKWIPLIVGFIGVLTLRSAIVGTIMSAIDIMILTAYFALYSLWRFWYMLHSYGHNLDPRAAVHVDPFTPPIFGFNLVGQFEVYSLPSIGFYFFAAFGLLVAAGIFFSIKEIYKKA